MDRHSFYEISGCLTRDDFVFEGKDCSFLVAIVCEARGFYFYFYFILFFSNIILIALLCKDFKGFNRDSLAEPRELRHSLYVIGYGLGKMFFEHER